MDPVTIGAVILAIVSGEAGNESSKLLNRLKDLINRYLGRQAGAANEDAKLSGVEELADIIQNPADQQGAINLARILLARSKIDATFEQGFNQWWEQASQVLPAMGNTTNTISGGTQYGPVLQGRDFTNVTFGSPQSPPKDSNI